MQIKTDRTLTLFRLVMINIIAVDSLRNISITAQAGWIVITFYVLAAIFFLIPCALLTAEMATGHTKNGGIYLWTKEAFGKKIAFTVLWLQWLYNLVWFPSICGFFAGIIAYIVGPYFGINPNELVMNPWYMICMSLGMFWLATVINLYGIKMSSTLSVIGAIVGTLLPMALIIILAFSWVVSGHEIAAPKSVYEFLPSMSNMGSWALFLTAMFSLFGLEMSSIHAGNVKSPKKNFPKALMISSAVILLSLVLSNMAIYMISAANGGHVDIVTGLMASFYYFFNQFNLAWLSVVIALTLVLGAFTTVSTWIMGLSRAFSVAAEDGLISKKFAQCNDHQAPSKVLILQAAIFSVFCLSYLLMPSVNSAYWFLSALTAQLAVIAYVGMFAAAIKLRLSQPLKVGQYQISKSVYGTVLMAGLGFVGCIVAVLVGFIPTSDVQMSALSFDTLLITSIVIALIIPYFMLRKS